MNAYEYLEKIALPVQIGSLMKLPKQQALDALKLHYPKYNPHALYGGMKLNGNPNLKVSEYLKTKGIISNPSGFKNRYFNNINKKITPINSPAPINNPAPTTNTGGGIGKKLLVGGGLTAAGSVAAYGAMG